MQINNELPRKRIYIDQDLFEEIMKIGNKAFQMGPMERSTNNKLGFSDCLREYLDILKEQKYKKLVLN